MFETFFSLAFEAARLSAVGLGMLLLLMCAARAVHFGIWHLRYRPVGIQFLAYEREFTDFPEIRKADGFWTVIVGFIVALVPLFAFVPAVLAMYMTWLEMGEFRGFAIISCWLLILLEVHYLWRLAFNPPRKLIWATGWIAFAHIIAIAG